MNGTKDIEARLDRSLRNQVQAPQLGRGFDAAVWARIAAEETKAANPGALAVPSRALRASRWMALTNGVGIAVTIGIALYFGLRALGGIEVPHVDLSLPAISEDLLTRIITVLGQVLGIAALLFGLSLTSVGRRLRASLT